MKSITDLIYCLKKILGHDGKQRKLQLSTDQYIKLRKITNAGEGITQTIRGNSAQGSYKVKKRKYFQKPEGKSQYSQGMFRVLRMILLQDWKKLTIG